MDKSKKRGLGGRHWAALLIFGLYGQIAWMVENMYFNVYLYKTVTYDPNAVAVMVAASAIVATLTTLLMGQASDKAGRRKPFITIGYIIWGLVIMSFTWISKENTARLFPAANAAALTTVLIVAMDCVMTFFGSTANDAAFNAWVTDITVPETRGRADGALAALQLAALLIIFGGFDGLTQKGNWTAFYCAIGGLVTLGGVAGLFVLKEGPKHKVEKPDLLYGFRPGVVRANPQLYRILLLIGLYCTAYQIFFPYLMIYLEYFLGLSNYAILLAVVLVVAAVLSVLGGRLVDRLGKRRFFLPAGLVYTGGLLLMYLHGRFLRTDSRLKLPLLALAAIIMMGGSLLLSLVANAAIRDYTPEAQRGHFNGVRMIFMVLLPMALGPFIGARIIRSGPTYLDEYGAAQIIPNMNLFLGAALFSLLMFIPMGFLLKHWKREEH
ncbi:MAG: MFS transporter [Oscillospiraceae bacterium]|jgi:MFS family permease|nr:MFS transporter [Oscillospiraceae bacterium]